MTKSSLYQDDLLPPGPRPRGIQGTRHTTKRPFTPRFLWDTRRVSFYILLLFMLWSIFLRNLKGFEKLFDWWSNMGDIQNTFTSNLTTTRGINRILPLKRPHPVYIYCRQLEVCFIANYSTLYCRTGTTCLTNHSQRPTTSRLFFTLARGFCLEFFSPLWFCH